MTCSKAAASSTLLDMGPMWSKVHASGKHPYLATKPWVGFKPTSPQAADGIRIEPAVSVPSVERTYRMQPQRRSHQRIRQVLYRDPMDYGQGQSAGCYCQCPTRIRAC